MSIDLFSERTDQLERPATAAVSVSKSDSVDLTYTTRALYVGVAGDVSVQMAGGGSAVIFKNVFGLLPVRVSRVNATATTASEIVALW